MVSSFMVLAAALVLSTSSAASPPPSISSLSKKYSKSHPSLPLHAIFDVPHARMNRRYRSVISEWADVEATAPEVPTVFPWVYGADPTGMTDSTAAFTAAVAALLQKNTSSHVMSFDVVDLGGATLDLGGGDYLISSPIAIPVNFGNFRIISGTLRASSTFPPERWLIEIGSESACKNGQGSCNQDASIAGVYFDCMQICAGGIRISATMGANVGPQNFLFNFTQAGIQLDGGHEVFIHETWLGEFAYSDPRKENGNASTATGIIINGNDHFLNGVIIYSSRIGVAVNGAANLIQDTHTWNLALSNGGFGFIIRSSQNRFDGVYLDFNNIVFENAQAQTLIDSFFLCGGHTVFAPQSAKDTLDGVALLGNEYWCEGQGVTSTIEFNNTMGTYVAVTDFTVVGTVAQSGFTLNAPTATKIVTWNTPTTTFTADFTSALAFPTSVAPIQSIMYSIVLPNGVFVSHAARAPAAGSAVVVIETQEAVIGTVTISVDQSVHTA